MRIFVLQVLPRRRLRRLHSFSRANSAPVRPTWGGDWNDAAVLQKALAGTTPVPLAEQGENSGTDGWGARGNTAKRPEWRVARVLKQV